MIAVSVAGARGRDMAVFQGTVEVAVPDRGTHEVHAVLRRVRDHDHEHIAWQGTLSGTLGTLPSDGEVEVTFPEGTVATAQVAEVTSQDATVRTVWVLGYGSEPDWTAGG